MKIVICGSMNFAKEMLAASKILKTKGHETVLPITTMKHIEGTFDEEGDQIKKNYDVFNYYFNEIKNSDAILVLNYDKNGIQHYIGGNSLIEMGFAHVLGKTIYLLYPVPEISYSDEIRAMESTILDGDVGKIE